MSLLRLFVEDNDAVMGSSVECVHGGICGMCNLNYSSLFIMIIH